MDWSSLPLGSIGSGGLITFVVLLVLTDRLVWHKRLDLIQQRAEAAERLAQKLADQNDLLLRSAIPTVNSVLTALHQAVDE